MSSFLSKAEPIAPPTASLARYLEVIIVLVNIHKFPLSDRVVSTDPRPLLAPHAPPQWRAIVTLRPEIGNSACLAHRIRQPSQRAGHF